MKSLRLQLTAISTMLRLRGNPFDVKDARLSAGMGGIEGTKGRRESRQASLILPDLLKRMVAGAKLAVRSQNLLQTTGTLYGYVADAEAVAGLGMGCPRLGCDPARGPDADRRAKRLI